MNHPHLTELFQIYTSETQPFRKVHRMIDLFESLIKMHTVVIISAYIKQLNLSDSSKGMLAQGLRTPSLGTWQLFSRVLFDELEQNQYEWKLSDFSSSFKALDKALNASKTNVIAFRNGYAHGATPTDEQCEKDIKQFEPFLIQLFKSGWLSASSIQYRENRVWITADNYELCLHPILLFKEDGGSSPYAFFNDLKNDKVGLLNYPLSKHYREKDFYNEFHQYLPLNEWKKIGNSEFDQRIEELTESFKGRTIERDKLLKFVLDNNKGYISIQGNPGIGKSALVSQFLKDLKPYFEIQNLQTVEYFIRRGTAQAKAEYLLNYLLRKTDELFSGGREVRADGKEIWDLQQQLFSKWRLWGELNPNRKLLFLIDGLDEAVENDIVTYLPRETFDGILFVYGSRPGGHKSIDDLWTQLPVEYHSKLELLGLGKADIRALIYEVVNKYEIERESQWVDAIENRSQGNPLYLKLLCDAMSNGLIPLNDTQALPHTIDDYYKAILDRYAHDPDGDALLCALYTFAAARDYLTITHLGIINKLGEATLQRISSTLKEVLYENPFTEHVLDYQLFHESFREYLVKEKKSQVNDASERIIDFCSSWKSCDGLWEQRYPLEYYSEHLADSKKEERTERLISLIYDEDFIKTQQNILEHYGATSNLYKNALQKASDLKSYDDAHEAALCLIDLKYEEANDAPKIVALVAKGEIDLVLKRIESFGDADTKGLKRKFNLYMLCLIELTLLESKNKPFNKIAIEKILNHFDENIPIDHEQLNWNDFFSSYLIFLMACEWKLLGIDYLRIYKRANVWNTDWVVSKAPYSETQFEILYETIALIGPEFEENNFNLKIDIIELVITELIKRNEIQKAIDFARNLRIPLFKSQVIASISLHLFNRKDIDLAKNLINEAYEYAKEVNRGGWIKAPLLASISTNLFLQGRLIESASLMKEAIEIAQRMSVQSNISHSLRLITIEYAKQGNDFAAIQLANEISESYYKSHAFKDISIELFRQGKVQQSQLQINNAIEQSRDSCYLHFFQYTGWLQSPAMKDISTFLFRQGKVLESEHVMFQAIELIKSLSNEFEKITALLDISNEFFKQGRLDKCLEIVEECLGYVSLIKYDLDRVDALSYIIIRLLRFGELSKSQNLLTSISDNIINDIFLSEILNEYALIGKVDEVTSMIFNQIKSRKKSESRNGNFLINISVLFVKLERINEAIDCINHIDDDSKIDQLKCIVSNALFKNGNFEAAFDFVRSIKDKTIKGKILMDFSRDYIRKGDLHNSNCLIHEVLEIARELSELSNKIDLFNDVFTELFHQSKFDISDLVMKESLECARSITKESEKSQFLRQISTILHKINKFEDSQLVMQEAIDAALTEIHQKELLKEKVLGQLLAEGVTPASEYSLNFAFELLREMGQVDVIISDALSQISLELIKQGKIQEGIDCTCKIHDETKRIDAFAIISTVLFEQGNFEKSNNILNNSIFAAKSLLTDLQKSESFLNISIQQFKQKKEDDCKFFISEAIKCCAKINQIEIKDKIYRDIALVFGAQGQFSKAENVSLGIKYSSIRHACWELISQMIIEKDGFDLALNSSSYFLSDEAKLYYLRTWAQSITVNDITKDLSNKAILVLSNDSLSLEHFMQVQAQYEILYGSISNKKMNRLNKTLNIQWLIDIISKFPKKETFLYTSTNVSEWIALISDVDDREEIELLARKVSKGKMTEEDFSERIKSFIN